MMSKEALEEKKPLYVCSVDSQTGRVDTYHDPFGKNPRKKFLNWLLVSKIHIFTKLGIESDIFHPKDFNDCRTLSKK